MASDVTPDSSRTPIGLRRPWGGARDIFRGVTRANYAGQILAGVTLVAIAIPEQLATSQLAGVPAFLALIAFITATLVFVLVGSNPIVSVGADSTIAPLFAVVLIRLAPVSSTLYLELVAVTAVVTGLAVMAVGLLKLGWIADFLSLPIVTGFLFGIGVIIVVHQLPSALGIAHGGTSILQRLDWIVHHLSAASGWSIALALGTLALMLAGDKINARVPWALGAIVLATILCATLSLQSHGVSELGTVVVGLPSWRLRWLTTAQWGLVLTTSVTLVIVILSQSAATTRTAADELGIEADISRDFVGVGMANVVAGLVGTFPVDASPARTTVARLAGGSTKVVGLCAAVIATSLSPLASYAHMIPLAALAGVLIFIASRLMKVALLKEIWRASRIEFLFAAVSALGVIFIGVEQGIAIAVGLAVLDQTWRSARPHMVVLGRHDGTTSWEPLGSPDVSMINHTLVVIFDNDLFFANSGVFRRDIHELLAKYPQSRHLVLDAVAMAEIDFTGMTILSQVVHDLNEDMMTISFARVNQGVKKALSTSFDPLVRAIPMFESVDEAVVAVTS
jgi:MFS superfamily sulfate permease-like transporter